MDISCLGNKVIVEQIEHDLGGGIVLPDNITSGLTVCRVVAVGEGRVLETGAVVKPPVVAGDEVWFHPNGAIRLEPISAFGGRKLLAVETNALLCKVTRTPQDVIDAATSPKLLVPNGRKVKELVA